MSKSLTIAEAASKALESLARPSSAEEIYAEIEKLDLYKFNTPTPIHVLETELKRYSIDSPRSDTRYQPRFRINPDKTYAMSKDSTTTANRSQTLGMKRIMRAADKSELIEELMSSRLGIFREIWRLLLFSAQIGLISGKREPLKAVDPGKGIDQATFGNSSSWPGILYLIGLADSGDPEILVGSSQGEDQRIQLFQEYANGGLSILRDFFQDRVIDIEGFVAFIESYQAKQVTLESPDLDLSI